MMNEICKNYDFLSFLFLGEFFILILPLLYFMKTMNNDAVIDLRINRRLISLNFSLL